MAADVRWPLGQGYSRKYVMTPQRGWGGYPAATSRQFRALQLQPHVVSVRGPDLAGAFVVEEATRAEVNVNAVRLAPDFPTREAQIVEYRGERTILIEKRLFARLEPDDLDHSTLGNVALWCAGGSLDDPGPTDPVLERLLQLARDLGKPVCLNPSRINALKKLNLSGVDLVQISSDDNEALGFASDATAAEVAGAFLERGAAMVIVTAGPASVRGFTQDGQSVVMPAIPVLKPVHPTGAGDCVSAVHAWGLVIERLDLGTALDYGVAAGARWVATGQPTSAAEIRALVRSQPPSHRNLKAA
jgi:sugar/nucleoside kinase (ribokinase family)